MPAQGQRIMQKLGRGLVAVKSGTGTYLSWRLWGTEQGTDIAFNIYKGTAKLNSAPITTSTNYQDTSSGSGDYSVKAVIGGVEEATGEKAMLNLQNDYLDIPLQDAGGRAIHLGYVGDLDGDGEMEYIVDRVSTNVSQYVDAYHRDGTFMWRVDMGPNSTNTDLSLSGPDTISVGHADNEAVFDVDSDGKDEVVLRGANGMIFGDKKVLNASTTQTDSFIVAIDGKTGAEKGKECAVPQDLKSTGNVTGHFSSAYWDGVHPSLYYKGKAGGTAAMMDMGFDFKDGAWSLRFKAVRTPIGNYPNNHNIRCVDLDRDGIDECVNGGYAIKGDGSIFWNMFSQGIGHGDRWHIGAMDPKAGADLVGWGVGQRLAYDWYEYNAKTGTVLRKYGNSGQDMARGTCGDVDPTHPGYECWTGGKVFNMVDLTGAQIGSDAPPQNFRIWWDGDLLSENLDDVTISKWSYPGAPAFAFTSKKLDGVSSWRQAVPLYGDMFGDWREEVMLENTTSKTLRIYTTTIPTDKRIYTLMHDPEYRNSMNEKGYQQSRMVDYYLGDGMTDPPRPNIKYPDGSGAAGAGGGGTTGAAGAGGGGTTGAAGQAGGGTTGTVDTSAAPTGGTAATEMGGTSGAEGGTLATGGNTVVSTTAPIPTAGTSAVVPSTGGSTNNGGGGAAGGQAATGPLTAAAASGCSCAIGATSGRASAGYLVAMLSMLGLALNRRRRRTGFRD